MNDPLLLPRLTANDDIAEIAFWRVNDGDFIEAGREVVDMASSKATFTVIAEKSGYVWRCAEVGAAVKVGDPVAVLYPSLEALDMARVEARGRKASLEAAARNDTRFSSVRFSAAAKEIISRENIDEKLFEGQGLVTSRMVEERRKTGVPLEVTSRPVPGSVAGRELRSEAISAAKRSEIRALAKGNTFGLASSLTVELEAGPILLGLKSRGLLGVQLLPIIIYELAKLLEENPLFTSYFEDDRIYFYDRIDIGLAIDLGKGLKVPVIREANELLPIDIYQAIVELSLLYYQDSLTVSHLTGSTITLTDLSHMDVRYFQPLLNARQSVILGIGGDSKAPGHPITLTLVFDHRVLTGKDVGAFLNRLKDGIMFYNLESLDSGPRS